MKSLVKNIRDFNNQRSRATDSSKEAIFESKTLAKQNGESATRLLSNKDFALMFNLYRFNMLEQLEDAETDEKRISNAHYVAGVRDFITYIEKLQYLGKIANKRSEEQSTKE